MFRHWLFPAKAVVFFLTLAILEGSRANAQPVATNTWTATASGNWSTAGNWSPATVPTSANTTILQFNGSGTTSYTATNDISDPFSIQGLLFNSSSSNVITLAGNATTGLAFSTAGPSIFQNNTGAVVINNNINTNNSSSGSDLNFGGYGSGTVTIAGVVGGTGGIQLTDLGGATFVLANGANSFLGNNSHGLTSPIGTWNPFGTLVASASSGTPLGTGLFTLFTGNLAIAPVATGTDVTVGVPGGIFTFFAGGTLILNKGGNTSLTFTTQAISHTITGNSNGTMVVAPASGLANFGLINSMTGTPAGETFTTGANAAQPGATTPINGMLAPTNVGQFQATPTDTTADFLTYYNGPTTVGSNQYNGFAQATGEVIYNTNNGAFSTSTTGTEISAVTANTTASVNANIQALRVGTSAASGTTLTIGSGVTLTIGGQAWNGASLQTQSGIILNNGAQIAGPGTLAVGTNELDIYASTGTSTISAQITSTAVFQGLNAAIIKFGPGNVVLTNSNNSFSAAGTTITLYGGALVIPGPGGSNQSTVLGTGPLSFIDRGGAFGITGGDYAPNSNVSFTFVHGGGGFFVDGTSTLTLANSGNWTPALGTTGTGPLYKTGTGTLSFTFPYSLQGLTGVLVNQGTFQVNAALSGNIAPATGGPVPTIINSTGTVTGTGSLPGQIIVKSGGTISPGVGGNIAAFGTGGLVFEPGGGYQFKYNPGTATPVAGTDNSELTSTIAGSTLDLSNLSSSNKFNVSIVPSAIAIPPGGSVTYTAGAFASPVILPAGITAANLSTLFNFTGVFSGTPTANLANGNDNLTFTFTPTLLTSWTWTGSSGSNWSGSNNWSPAVVPSSSNNTLLTFGATLNPVMTNDISGGILLNGMTFNAGSPAYSLSGNALTFQTNAVGTTPSIVTNSSNSVTISAPITLTNSLTVNGSGNVALTGLISGASSITMSGTGTLTLGNSGNAFTGGVNAQNGTIAVATDSALGTGSVTGSAGGFLTFTGTTATARSFSMNLGTLAVAGGQTVTFNGDQISGATLDGSGTFSSNGAQFVNVTTTTSTIVVSTSAADRFVHFTNGGAFNVAANLNSGTSTVLNGFTNQGSGIVMIGANSQINVANFQSYGELDFAPGSRSTGGSGVTLLKNVGTSQLFFNGGSRTFLATVATASTLSAGIDLNGQNAVVAGGLFVNNGYIIDSSNGGTGTSTIIADYNALVKGAGFFQNSPVTRNGGRVQAGNSPGAASFGQFVFGPGGVSDYVFAIDNATGTAGPTADANGQVSGWGLVNAVRRNVGASTTSGDFVWTASANNKVLVSLDTLVNPTTAGTDVSGLMANFDPNQAYSWLAAKWSGTYSGPTDAATLDAATGFDTSGFENPIAGTFGWSLDPAAQTLSLTYTPSAVPEPGTLVLVGLAAAGLAYRRRRINAASR